MGSNLGRQDGKPATSLSYDMASVKPEQEKNKNKNKNWCFTALISLKIISMWTW